MQRQQILSLREIQNELLLILEDFHNFCFQNDLRYTLIGGSLLGAIRHQGFIPWDDDIDVGMPRKDYEFLIKNYNSTKFHLIPQGTGQIALPYTKIVNEMIQVHEGYTKEGYNTALWIDVLPFDGIPDNRKLPYRALSLLRKVIGFNIASFKHKNTSNEVIDINFLKKTLQSACCSLRVDRVAMKIIDWISRRYLFDECDMVGVIGWGLYGDREPIPRNGFDNLCLVKFEGHNYYSMSCWDEYLSNLYGDYMTPPSPSDRHTHDVTAWRMT